MGLLGRIGEAVKNSFKSLLGIKRKPPSERIGETVLNRFKRFLGIKRKPPSEKIRAALRKQWLEVGKDQEIPGVEWEGEVYFDTPH